MKLKFKDALGQLRGRFISKNPVRFKLKNSRKRIVPITILTLFFVTLFVGFQNFSTPYVPTSVKPTSFVFIPYEDYPIPVPVGGNFSKNWASVEQQILAAADAQTAVGIAQGAGLRLYVYDGGSVSNTEFSLVLVDPVTANIVAHLNQHAAVTLTNVPPVSQLNSQGSTYVCPYNGSYLSMELTNGGNLIFDSILTPGTTNVPVDFLPSTMTNDPMGLLSKTVQAAASNLTSNLGLQISANSIVPGGFNSNSPTPAISLGCSANVPSNATAVTDVIVTDSGTKIAKIRVNCNAFTNGSLLQVTIEHEILHALGFAHDSGVDIMDYSYSTGTAFFGFTLPAGAKSAVQAQTSAQNVNIDFSTCQTRAAYHNAQCAKNPGFEFGCNTSNGGGGGNYNGSGGGSGGTTGGGTSCGSNSCSGGNVMDPSTCACYCPMSGCQAGYTFDPSSCTCTQSGGGVVNPGGCSNLPTCGANQIFNTSTCSCDTIGGGGGSGGGGSGGGGDGGGGDGGGSGGDDGDCPNPDDSGGCSEGN